MTKLKNNSNEIYASRYVSFCTVSSKYIHSCIDNIYDTIGLLYERVQSHAHDRCVVYLLDDIYNDSACLINHLQAIRLIANQQHYVFYHDGYKSCYYTHTNLVACDNLIKNIDKAIETFSKLKDKADDMYTIECCDYEPEDVTKLIRISLKSYTVIFKCVINCSNELDTIDKTISDTYEREL